MLNITSSLNPQHNCPNVSMINKEIYIDWNKTLQIFLSFCLVASSPEINTSHCLSRTVVLHYYAPLLCPWR